MLRAKKPDLERNFLRQWQSSAEIKGPRLQWVSYLIWEDELNPQAIDKIEKELQYDRSERVLEINAPPKKLKSKLEGLSIQTFFDFSDRFRRPVAEVIYTALRAPVVKQKEPAPCIPIAEARGIGRVISNTGFEVLGYEQKINGLILVYASPHIADHINYGIANTERDLAVIKEHLKEATLQPPYK